MTTDFKYKHEDQMRFVFNHRGTRVGITQDDELVRECAKDGLPTEKYERMPGVFEWEVKLGTWPPKLEVVGD